MAAVGTLGFMAEISGGAWWSLIGDILRTMVLTLTRHSSHPQQVEGKGSHFDSDVVDAFLDAQDEFRSIARQLSDSEEDTEVADSACDVHRQSRPKQWTAWSVK
jgi:hypothetical protein